MRKIAVGKWTEKLRNADGTTSEQEVTLLNALSLVLNMKRPEDMPRGFEKFRLFSKVTKAFEHAEKTGTLELEDAEYNFLKAAVETDIPASWGANPDIMKAVEAFMDAK